MIISIGGRIFIIGPQGRDTRGVKGRGPGVFLKPGKGDPGVRGF